MRNLTYAALLTLTLLPSVGCGGDDAVDSDEQARRAYLGLDKAVGKAMTLGFAGFHSATNANITPQTTNGDKAGTMTVSGQVDQGASNNKGMRLDVGMVGYDDGDIKINDNGDTIHVVYDTDTTLTNQPYLTMMMNNIPTGTLDGMLTSNTSMTGVFNLSGDIKGKLTLMLTITGTLMGTSDMDVTRVVGSTTVTGTATNSDGGSYNIMLMI